jgi:hypothetical protein
MRLNRSFAVSLVALAAASGVPPGKISGMIGRASYGGGICRMPKPKAPRPHQGIRTGESR